MLDKVAAIVAVAAVIAVPCAGVAAEPSAQEPGWLTHTYPEARLEISYPADWEVIVAEQRLGSGTMWSPRILGKGELFKVAFRESGDIPWAGWYEIRVLANKDKLTLDDYWAGFDLSDLWDRSDADSTLAGRPSKTWVRWRPDSLVREHLLVTVSRAIHILYDEHNSNDPAFEDHQEIYEHMTSTFRVLFVGEPGAPTTGRQATMELQHSFQTPTFARALNIIYGMPEGLSKGEVQEFAGNGFHLVHAVTTTWESLGVLVHHGEVDLQLIDDFFSGPIIVSWRKVAPSGYL